MESLKGKGEELQHAWVEDTGKGEWQERAQSGPAQLGEDGMFSRRSSSASRTPLEGREEQEWEVVGDYKGSKGDGQKAGHSL